MPKILLLSLLLTLVLELPFAWAWGLRNRDLMLVAGMNLITNPLVVLWLYSANGYGCIISVLLAELAAVVAEAFLLARFGKTVYKPILLAVCLNVFSYFAGWLIQYLIYIF